MFFVRMSQTISFTNRSDVCYTHQTFYTRQTSATHAGVCACDRTHKMIQISIMHSAGLCDNLVIRLPVTFVLIGIHCMQGRTATTSHEIKRKKVQKDQGTSEICLQTIYS